MIKLKNILNENSGLEVTVDELKSIDYSPLIAQIKKQTGIKIKIDTFEIIRGKYFKLGSSKDLVSTAGPFKAALKKLIIQTFDGQKTEDYHWMVWGLDYENKAGGHNGQNFLTAWYYPNKNKWEFREN